MTSIMILDTRTTIFMICFVYLILHGAIWLALQEYRSNQVKLWCAAGSFSGMAVVLFAMRGKVPDFLFLYVAQLLMLVGNWGRMVALHMYLPARHKDRTNWIYALAHIFYFMVFVYLTYYLQAEWEALMLFNAFYAVMCFEYFRMGVERHRLRASLGARLLMWGGLSLSSTLAVRFVGVAMAGSIDDIYAPSWHQAVMVIGQFLGITLCNIAFFRIFLEIAEQQKMAVSHELILTTERADAMQRASMNLKQLLDEREEIIRQLTLFNKTAGMGALVASLAHELNQPLTVIQMNTDMIELVLNDHEKKPNQDNGIERAMTSLRKANQRAATIISTLRNMFGSGRKSLTDFDFNEIINDVLMICHSTLQRHSINVIFHSDPNALRITGDKSQLQQVILNLITNASEAFPEGFQGVKEISIQTSLEGSDICLTVTDNGMGIEPDIQTMVFELLRTNKKNGMGIGLWLSKTIVEAHQGSINFTTAMHQGTVFRVRLPAHTEPLYF